MLDAAAGQFAERGYAATTIDDVAGAARVSKGTVYYHFADKAQLFEAVFRNRQARLLDTVATAVEGCRGPWERLQAGLDAYLEGSVADEAHRNLLQQAPSALGAERCRQIDEEMGLPVVRLALAELASTGELVDRPSRCSPGSSSVHSARRPWQPAPIRTPDKLVIRPPESCERSRRGYTARPDTHTAASYICRCSRGPRRKR